MKEYYRGDSIEKAIASLEKNSFSAGNYRTYTFSASSTQSDWDAMWAFINTGAIVWVNATTNGSTPAIYRNLLMNSSAKLFCAVAADGTIYKIDLTEAKASNFTFYIWPIKN